MNKRPTKHTNKNITVKSSNDMTTDRRYGDSNNSTGSSNRGRDRSYKTIGTGYQDTDDLLDNVLGEDETDKPQSKALSKANNSGKPLHKLDRDGQRVGKAVRQPAVKSAAPSNTSDKQRGQPVAAIVGNLKPVITGTDKMHLSVPVDDLQLDRAIEVALQLVKLREKPLTHRSVKGEWFRHKFVFTFGSHTYAKPCQAILKMKSTKPGVKLKMEIDLNPNNLITSDVGEWIGLWRDLFGVHARDLAQRVGCMRIDHNADCPYRTDDLIIDLDGAKMGEKYFIKTDSGAKIQSNYAGSASSAEHLLAYDQDGSEAHREEQARVAGYYQEPAHADDALIHLKKVAGGERTRVETRRVFTGQHPKVSELGAIADPFGRVHVYQIKSAKAKSMSVEFLAYLDCVRIRGINGAGRYLIKQAGNTKEVKSKVQAYERQLTRLAAPWWSPQDFNANAIDLLMRLPIWRFLKPSS